MRIVKTGVAGNYQQKTAEAIRTSNSPASPFGFSGAWGLGLGALVRAAFHQKQQRTFFSFTSLTDGIDLSFGERWLKLLTTMPPSTP
jgi:hypothetical protein